jgi:hypothetical protein
LPNTGTVQTDRVSGLPPLQPGRRLRPNQYCVPSTVVTFQCSPSSSPLAAPLRCSMREPSSTRGCQAPVAPSLISSTVLPPSDRVALSLPQHWSPVLTVLLAPPPRSSEQAL